MGGKKKDKDEDAESSASTVKQPHHKHKKHREEKEEGENQEDDNNNLKADHGKKEHKKSRHSKLGEDGKKHHKRHTKTKVESDDEMENQESPVSVPPKHDNSKVKILKKLESGASVSLRLSEDESHLSLAVQKINPKMSNTKSNRLKEEKDKHKVTRNSDMSINPSDKESDVEEDKKAKKNKDKEGKKSKDKKAKEDENLSEKYSVAEDDKIKKKHKSKEDKKSKDKTKEEEKHKTGKKSEVLPSETGSVISTKPTKKGKQAEKVPESVDSQASVLTNKKEKLNKHKKDKTTEKDKKVKDKKTKEDEKNKQKITKKSDPLPLDSDASINATKKGKHHEKIPESVHSSATTQPSMIKNFKKDNVDKNLEKINEEETDGDENRKTKKKKHKKDKKKNKVDNMDTDIENEGDDQFLDKEGFLYNLKDYKKKPLRNKTKIALLIMLLTFSIAATLSVLLVAGVISLDVAGQSSLNAGDVPRTCPVHLLEDGLIQEKISEKVMKYSCSFGRLEQNTSNAYECLDTGYWNNTIPPKCVLRECPDILGSIKNGIVLYGNRPSRFYHEVDTWFFLKCDQGLKPTLHHHNNIYYCEKNYKWSFGDNVPQCFGGCGDPKPILNGSMTIVRERTGFGELKIKPIVEEVKYECDDGFRLVPTVSTRLYCNFDTNVFEPKLPECKPFCGPALKFPNTERRVIERALFSPQAGFPVKVEHFCSNGADFLGSKWKTIPERNTSVSECTRQKPGKFTRDDDFICTNDCPDIRYSKCLTAEVTNTKFGTSRLVSTTEMKYYCNNKVLCNFNRYFKGKTTCGYDGRWSLSIRCHLTVSESFHEQCPMLKGLFDNSFTVSDFKGPGYEKDKARSISFNGAFTGQGGWASDQENAWIEVDFRVDKTVYSIATQGIGRVIDDDNYVESYNIMYQKKGEAEYQYMRDDDGKIIEFFGNSGSKDTHFNDFPRPTSARKFRLVVQTYHGFAALRWELYNCDPSF